MDLQLYNTLSKFNTYIIIQFNKKIENNLESHLIFKRKNNFK